MAEMATFSGRGLEERSVDGEYRRASKGDRGDPDEADARPDGTEPTPAREGDPEQAPPEAA
jgi:hypothetical protein